VPLLVPAAWFAMALPAREVAHGALGSASTPRRRIALGAFALTAWDLFLDPQMVGEGYWRWHRRGRYRGIPLSNFMGWLVVSAGVMAVLERTLPPLDKADGGLVGEYTVIGVMETVGFARYFRDPVVAVVGGAAMLPMAVAAVVNRRKRR
jgi:putative membrane protein